MKKVILAFDSFKGSVSAKEITYALQHTIHVERNDLEVIPFPIADGGEGTSALLAEALGATTVRCEVHDPLMRPIIASYAITQDRQTAIIEVAAAAGLTLLSEEELNPMKTSTYGVGEMVLDAVRRGCTHILMGLGGSATNDAGTGILSVFGVAFHNREGNKLVPCGGALDKIEDIDISALNPALKDVSFTLICDVENPLFGPNGSAYVFAPQKGATPEMVETLDNGLRHYSELINSRFGTNIGNRAKMGAAGGIAGGLFPFFKTEMKSGSLTVLEMLGFEEKVKEASLVLTGEGKVDRQTGMGKALQGVFALSKKYNVPVVALGGSVEAVEELNERGCTAVFSIQFGPVTLEDAMKKEYALKQICRTASQIIRLFFR